MKYTLQNIDFKSIKEMPETERPRERMESKGSLSLSDLELMCIILGSGTRNCPVQDIAEEILEKIAYLNGNPSFEELMTIDGLGPAKAAVVCASLELGRRFGTKMKKHISDSEGIWQQIRHFGDREQEHFLCVMLNGALEVMGVRVVTVGLTNRTLVHPREIFNEAIKMNSTAIVIAHNHPSGNLEPSSEDLSVTKVIRDAGNLLGIKVLDHIIFSSESYVSLKETGEFWF